MEICANCFNDVELKSFIASSSKKMGVCAYCRDGNKSELIDVKEILDFFSDFINIFQKDKQGIELCELIQQDWNFFSENTNSHKLLDDIIKQIDTDFDSSRQKVSYVHDILECISFWKTLKEELKWERRFLTNINKITELGWDRYFANNQIELSSNEKLYRARIHQDSQSAVFSKNNMGCPPKEKTSSGRANPQGIPYLYLSKSIDTTLYETRTFYLDEVSVGEFGIKDAMKIILIDFTVLPNAFGAFISDGIGSMSEYTKNILLKKAISSDLSKPLRRYDSELEYIPTQYICEYIRYITGADGILFNSSLHDGGKNVVLFEQEKVECCAIIKVIVKYVNIDYKIDSAGL